jgi:hypothetical protein
LSLRHFNTIHGHHRSIFVEDGLVGTVTAYHKGYSVARSTRIIHRYLPREVSELVVYYLWLVLPFRGQLDALAMGKREQPNPFLWPKAGDSRESWESSRLTDVLKREARSYLGVHLTILLYRHAAIAMSRVHLGCGGFKRDYGLDGDATAAAADQQSSHGSWMAGTIYARGLEEAPGHVEARRAEYRRVSREWHAFLGFQVYAGPRKRRLAEAIDGEAQAGGQASGQASGQATRRRRRPDGRPGGRSSSWEW